MSPQKLTKDMVERAEALASRIVGISSCKITTDETGEITEIHVVATSRKPAKLIARDVESCLQAELGIHVDHKKIGVVLFEQSDDDHSQNAPAAPTEAEESIAEFPVEEFPPRFVFQSVNLFISETTVKAEVELIRDGMEAFGSAQSEQGSTSNRDVIAAATLKAVSEFLDESIKLCLCDVLQVPLGDKQVVIVGADLIRRRDRKSLAGCCIVSGDEAQTVVFATLDAVNRVVGKLQPKSSIEYRVQ
jgi:hypothetical protein